MGVGRIFLNSPSTHSVYYLFSISPFLITFGRLRSKIPAIVIQGTICKANLIYTQKEKGRDNLDTKYPTPANK